MHALSVSKARPARALPAKSLRQRPQHNKAIHRKRIPLTIAAQADAAVATALPPIQLTDNALNHLKKLRADAGNTSMLLRVGVKQGGCSGLSYNMDFEKVENVSADDTLMEYDDGTFKIVCDPKSLLYLFGMQLDYSDALIGGGFQFHNPNASQSCGCGKSFGV